MGNQKRAAPAFLSAEVCEASKPCTRRSFYAIPVHQKNAPDRTWPGTKEAHNPMMISTKGRYALRMLVDMAEHERGGGYVPLKEIAARQEISEKYLESIVKLLVQNNVLIGVRGKGGGYRLNGTPDQFTVRRILEITEGSLAPVACLCEPHEPCARMANCRTYPMWQGLSKLIRDYLDSYTLADLMKRDDAGFDYII